MGSLQPCQRTLELLCMKLPRGPMAHVTRQLETSPHARNIPLCVESVPRSVVSDSWQYHGRSVHGILQARILERVAIPSPGDLPDPRIEPGSPALQADSYHGVTCKACMCREESLCSSGWSGTLVRNLPLVPLV